MKPKAMMKGKMMGKKHNKEVKAHHSGKGTRARLETAAEKSFFKSKVR